MSGTPFPVMIHVRFINEHLWAVGALEGGGVVVLVHVPNVVVFEHEATVACITAKYGLVCMHLFPMPSHTSRILETTPTYITAKHMLTHMHFYHVVFQTLSSRVRISSVALRTVQWLFIGWSFLAH